MGEPAASRHALAPVGVEQEVGAAEIGRPCPRRDLAAAPVEAAQHLLTELVGIGGRALEPGRSRQNTARGFGDFTPRASKIGQGPVEDAFEETSWSRSRIGHGGSGGPGLGRTRGENASAVNPQKRLATFSKPGAANSRRPWRNSEIREQLARLPICATNISPNQQLVPQIP